MLNYDQFLSRETNWSLYDSHFPYAFLLIVNAVCLEKIIQTSS